MGLRKENMTDKKRAKPLERRPGRHPKPTKGFGTKERKKPV